MIFKINQESLLRALEKISLILKSISWKEVSCLLDFEYNPYLGYIEVQRWIIKNYILFCGLAYLCHLFYLPCFLQGESSRMILCPLVFDTHRFKPAVVELLIDNYSLFRIWALLIAAWRWYAQPYLPPNCSHNCHLIDVLNYQWNSSKSVESTFVPTLVYKSANFFSTSYELFAFTKTLIFQHPPPPPPRPIVSTGRPRFSKVLQTWQI